MPLESHEAIGVSSICSGRDNRGMSCVEIEKCSDPISFLSKLVCKVRGRQTVSDLNSSRV